MDRLSEEDTTELQLPLYAPPPDRARWETSLLVWAMVAVFVLGCTVTVIAMRSLTDTIDRLLILPASCAR